MQRPLSGHAISKLERKRLADMGLVVPNSLAFGETPVSEFLRLLNAVASLRESTLHSFEGVKGRLEGIFYEIGCGTGMLCFAALMNHDFRSHSFFLFVVLVLSEAFQYFPMKSYIRF